MRAVAVEVGMKSVCVEKEGGEGGLRLRDLGSLKTLLALWLTYRDGGGNGGLKIA